MNRNIDKNPKQTIEQPNSKSWMRYYRKGYQQALKDINTPKKVVVKPWQPSECPQCKNSFYEFEPCNDGYYTRCKSMMRCLFCGQMLDWKEGEG